MRRVPGVYVLSMEARFWEWAGVSFIPVPCAPRLCPTVEG